MATVAVCQPSEGTEPLITQQRISHAHENWRKALGVVGPQNSLYRLPICATVTRHLVQHGRVRDSLIP